MSLDDLKFMKKESPKVDTTPIKPHRIDIPNKSHKDLSFIGPNGERCETPEALAWAREEHKRRTLYKIFFDAEKGRVEVPYGSGKVEICVGHKIVFDTDTSGIKTKRYVPVYRTEEF